MLGSLTDAGNVTTIASYLKLLASSFLVIPLERYSGSVIRQRGSQPKVITLDSSLISSNNNISKTEFLKDSTWKGRITENAVGARLWVEAQKIGGEIFYWRERDREVDFIVKDGLKIRELIQVCYNTIDIKTKERETRALIKASKELKCNNLIVITEDYEKEENIEWFGTKRMIKFIPLWKWLSNIN